MTNPNQLPYGGYEAWTPDSADHESKARRHKRLVGLGAGAVAVVSFGAGLLYFNNQNAEALHEPEAMVVTEYDTDPNNQSNEPTEPEPTEQETANLDHEYPQLTKESAQIDLSEIDSLADMPPAFVEVLSDGLMAGVTNENLETWQDFDEESDRYEFAKTLANEKIQTIAEGIFGTTEETSYENSQAFFDSLEPYFVYVLTESFDRADRGAYTAYLATFEYVDTEDIDNLNRGPMRNSIVRLTFTDNGDYSGDESLQLEFGTNAWGVDESGDVIYSLPYADGTVRFDKASALLPTAEETTEAPVV